MYISVVSSHKLHYSLAQINVSETYSVYAEVPEFGEDVKKTVCISGEIVISNYPSRSH